MMFKPLLAAAALSLVLAFPAGDAGARATGTTLVVDVPYLFGIDPSYSSDPVTNQLLYASCLKLVNYPDANGARGKRPVPEASFYPKVSKDLRTWTFTIKPGLEFSDGSTLDAADVVWSIDRQIWRRSRGGQLLSNVDGFQALWHRRTTTAPGVSVQGRSVVIRLRKRDNGLPFKLVMNNFCLLPQQPSYAPLDTPFPSAGPYVVQSFSESNQVVLARNPRYQGSRPRGADTIVLNDVTQAQAVQDATSGTVQVVVNGALPQSALARLHAAGTLQAHPGLETDYVALNSSRPLFASASTRRAVNFALDRPALLRQRGAFAGQVTDQILPPGLPGSRDVKIYPVSGAQPAKARQLLAGRCSPTHRCGGLFLTCDQSDCIKQGRLLHQQLMRVGIDLTVWSLDPSRLFDEIQKGRFDAVISGWSRDYGDPALFIAPLLDRNATGTNLSHFSDPPTRKRLEQADRLFGPARYRAYGQLDIDVTAHSAPWAPFDNLNEREFVSKHVKNYVFQPLYNGVDLAVLQVK